MLHVGRRSELQRTVPAVVVGREVRSMGSRPELAFDATNAAGAHAPLNGLKVGVIGAVVVPQYQQLAKLTVFHQEQRPV